MLILMMIMTGLLTRMRVYVIPVSKTAIVHLLIMMQIKFLTVLILTMTMTESRIRMMPSH